MITEERLKELWLSQGDIAEFFSLALFCAGKAFTQIRKDLSRKCP